MTSHEDDENCPPPPPVNPYLPENMRRPNPLPLQKDPNLVNKKRLLHREIAHIFRIKNTVDVQNPNVRISAHAKIGT